MVGGWADGTRTPRGRYVQGTEIVEVNRKHRELMAEVERLTAALAAERARVTTVTEALEWVRDECETVNRANHDELARAVIKSADFARYGLDSRDSERSARQEGTRA